MPLTDAKAPSTGLRDALILLQVSSGLYPVVAFALSLWILADESMCRVRKAPVKTFHRHSLSASMSTMQLHMRYAKVVVCKDRRPAKEAAGGLCLLLPGAV